MSHYYPRHVSGLDMPILRRNNCTNTASGILALLSGCTLHRLRAEIIITIDLLNSIILVYVSKSCVLQELLVMFVVPVELTDVVPSLQRDFPPGFLVRSYNKPISLSEINSCVGFCITCHPSILQHAAGPKNRLYLKYFLGDST